MKKLNSILILLLLLVASACSEKHPEVVSRPLNAVWKFKMASDSVWYPAAVPGTVHTDLLSNKLISDPFYGTNESKQQWIGKKNWVYQTRFDLDDQTFNRKQIVLIFKGLDTYAEVSLNGKTVLHANNMFRTWKVDAKKILRKKGNLLRVLFRSPMGVNKNRVAQLPYTLPADNDRSDTKVSVFTRKAPYQFGWDWGPRFVTCGIWRPVLLKAWDDVKIDDFQIFQQHVSDSLAALEAVTEIFSDTSISVKLQLYNGENQLKQREIALNKGLNRIKIKFIIHHPKLWWTNGLGKAHLYRFSVRLQKQGKKIDVKTTRFGIRTLEIVQKPDADGKSFYVKLNGVPVFMKGANYIPQDNFLPRVSKQKYKGLIQAAKDVHMNMIRVWGGGIYEDDEFYDLCDENGILVWQDFMFACSFYPGDTAFLENVKQEAIENVKWLRNHPSLALWCGNNEVRVAWERWGYQKRYHYSRADSAKIFGDYLNLFHHLLPKVVDTYDSGRFYWPSSPNSAPKGWDEEALSGDMHYWDVWWGRKPFSAYKQHVGRFMSEYGFQSLPASATIAAFTPDTSRYLISTIMRAHNKHPEGYQIIDQYMRRDFHVPEHFKDYIFISQLLQAEGMKTAIEAHRRAKPKCMGSLYWQLNDCWPVVSWSGIDYFGRWKALHYRLRKLFAPVLVSPVVQNGRLNIYLVSDLLQDKTVTFHLDLMDFYGKTIWHKMGTSVMKANTSRIIVTDNLNEIVQQRDTTRIFLHVSIWQGDSLLTENMLFFAKTKDLVLPKPRLQYKITNRNGQFEISITSKVFVKYVVLNWPDDTGIFSENYFSIMPNQHKMIKVKLKCTEKEFRKQLKIEPFY
jgi:beta-mannosidase